MIQHFFKILILIFLAGGCYQPEYPELKSYLLPEVQVIFGHGIEWDEFDTTNINVSLNPEEITFSLVNVEKNKSVSCRIIPHPTTSDKSFSMFTNSNELYDAIKLGEYKTNRSLFVNFQYAETKDESNINNASSQDLNLWDGADPEFCVFTITDKFIHENDIYLSGSFKAQTYKSKDTAISPGFIFYEGTFSEVAINKRRFK